MKGKEDREEEESWRSTEWCIEKDLLLSQEGGHGVRPFDLCPGGCVAHLELAEGAREMRSDGMQLICP